MTKTVRILKDTTESNAKIISQKSSFNDQITLTACLYFTSKCISYKPFQIRPFDEVYFSLNPRGSGEGCNFENTLNITGKFVVSRRALRTSKGFRIFLFRQSFE